MNIVITGASAGIGKALAVCYAEPGIHLGLIARNQEKLAAVAEVCRQQGATVEIAALDVTDAESLKRWLLAFDAQQPIDLLIANAGVTSVITDNGEAESWDAVQNVLNVNIHGVINSIYPLLAPMRQRQHGQLAIVSSLAAFYGMPISPAYCASKAAVKSYADALRGWLQHDGIQVSVICPGFVKSELSDQFPGKKLLLMSAEQAARIIKHGLARKKALISFPFPLDMGMRFLTVLPAGLVDWIFNALDYSGKTKTPK